MRRKLIHCIAWLLLPVLCFGGCNEKAEDSYDVEVDTTVDYSGIPEFLDSAFKQKLDEEGKTLYLPIWNAERFELVNLYTSHESCVFTFKDTGTGEVGYYQVTYDAYQQSVEDFAEGKQDTANDQIVTAENDRASYDVYLSAVPYQENEQYNLFYLPYENVMVYIGTERSTTEEILADFESFDLVPADEWNAP